MSEVKGRRKVVSGAFESFGVLLLEERLVNGALQDAQTRRTDWEHRHKVLYNGQPHSTRCNTKHMKSRMNSDLERSLNWEESGADLYELEVLGEARSELLDRDRPRLHRLVQLLLLLHLHQ